MARRKPALPTRFLHFSHLVTYTWVHCRSWPDHVEILEMKWEFVIRARRVYFLHFPLFCFVFSWIVSDIYKKNRDVRIWTDEEWEVCHPQIERRGYMGMVNVMSRQKACVYLREFKTYCFWLCTFDFTFVVDQTTFKYSKCTENSSLVYIAYVFCIFTILNRERNCEEWHLHPQVEQWWYWAGKGSQILRCCRKPVFTYVNLLFSFSVRYIHLSSLLLLTRPRFNFQNVLRIRHSFTTRISYVFCFLFCFLIVSEI